jgi:hypothetical protein
MHQSFCNINLNVKGRGMRPEAGGEREPNKFLLQELAYVISSIPKSKTLQEGDEHTNQQRKNNPLKVMNASKKE